MKSILTFLLLLLAFTSASASDYSVTASSVALIANPDPGGNELDGGTNSTAGALYTAAASITAGQPVYLYTSTTLKPANAATSSATAAVFGIALNSASSGQPVRVLRKGIYNPGFTGAASTIVILSGAADGGVCPTADLATGSRAVVIGVMPAANQLKVDFTTTAFSTSAAKP